MKRTLFLLTVILSSSTAQAKCFHHLITEYTHSKESKVAKVISVEKHKYSEACNLKLDFKSITFSGTSLGQLCKASVNSTVNVKVNSSCCDTYNCGVKTNIWFTK